MKRHSQKELKNWFSRPTRQPLILRGARQVGKSTLVRLFCEAEGLDLLEINLEKDRIRSAEKDELRVSEILDEIQLKTNKRIKQKALIFLDEIQEQPRLLKALRYFYEERPEIAMVAAGSLLEIAVRDEKFSFPVGRVEFHHLGPMTFSEFLEATGNEILLERISHLDFTDAVVAQGQEAFRNYLYVGGMPQAVKTYVSERSLVGVRAIQEQILQTYIADFPKYNSKISFNRVQRIFAAAVTQLGKKVIFQRFDQESQSREIRRVLELLIDARVLLPCFHSEGSSVPLAGQSDSSIHKLYFLDVGLANCLLRLDLETIDVELKNHFNTKGVIAEQFVAQHLAVFAGSALQPQLHYWLRDKGSQKGEIDFLIEHKQGVIPIEVKSTAAGHMKSLFYYIREKKNEVSVKLSLEPFSRQKVSHKIEDEIVSGHLVSFPIWAVEFLNDALKA